MSPDEIAQLALDDDQAQARVETFLGEAAHRLELLADQLLAVAQPHEVGVDRGDLAVAARDRLGQRLGPARISLATVLEQLALLLDQHRARRGEPGRDLELAARDLGLEPRDLGIL